jgi:hypothetical protein
VCDLLVTPGDDLKPAWRVACLAYRKVRQTGQLDQRGLVGGKGRHPVTAPDLDEGRRRPTVVSRGPLRVGLPHEVAVAPGRRSEVVEVTAHHQTRSLGDATRSAPRSPAPSAAEQRP